MGSFRNNSKASILAKEISNFHNRGFASAEKVQTVLNTIRETAEIKHLKDLNSDKVQEVVREIAEKVQENDISGKTGATYISALNQIVDYTNHFFDKNIEQIHYSDYFSKSIDYADKSVSETIHENFQNFLQEKFETTGDERFQALQYAVELQRSFGLRFRESIGLNKETIERGLENGKLELSRQDWTKNARPREIEIRTEYQRELLQNVQKFLENQKSVNLAGAQEAKSYQEIASFRSFADNIRQNFSEQTGENYNFHGERHFWAQNMYSQLFEEKTGVSIQAPIQYYSQELEKAGWDGSGKFYEAVKNFEIKDFWEYAKDQADMAVDKLLEIDKEIRMEISNELGHNRLDITNIYLGHP